MDPFVVLGVSAGATPQEIRLAWRQLAKKCHPDAGGDAQQMVLLNDALAQALEAMHELPSSTETRDHTRSSSLRRNTPEERTHRVRHDVSSFTFNVLPVESFELLEIVANSSGSVIESDCPYLLEFSLETFGDAFTSSDWCRCELVPEAGGTMVHLTIGGLATSTHLDVEVVRDELIRCINDIDGINLVEPQPS
jgi:curved DNA-binding protein CbpA